MKVKMMAGLVLGVLSSAHAELMFEGGHSGNGGGVHHCLVWNDPKFPNGTASNEFYDLWEGKNPLDAKNTKPLDIANWDGKTTKEQYIDRAVQKVAAVKPRLAAAIKRVLKYYQGVDETGSPRIQNRANLVEEKDAHFFFVATDCKYKQLVNWIDSPETLEWYGLEKEVILRDEAIYKEMNPRDQAASDFHEAVYKVRRAFELDRDDSGSVYVRKFVAQAFSTSPIQTKLYDLVGPFNTPQKFTRHFPKKRNSYYDDFNLFYVLKNRCSQDQLNQSVVEIENLNDFAIYFPGQNYDTTLKAHETKSIPAYGEVVKNRSYDRTEFYINTGKPNNEKDAVGFTFPYQLRISVTVCGQKIVFDPITVVAEDASYPIGADSNVRTQSAIRLEILSPPI